MAWDCWPCRCDDISELYCSEYYIMFDPSCLYLCNSSANECTVYVKPTVSGSCLMLLLLGGVSGLILSLTSLSDAFFYFIFFSCAQSTEEAPGIHLLWRHFKSFHPLSSPTDPVSEGVCLYQLYHSSSPSINISAQQMTGMMIEMTLAQG